MSKPPTEPRDWSSASEALFRAARADHAPNAADRERVRGELAQRLADASNTTLGGGDSSLEAASKTRVALSTLAKVGLGVVIVAAGALAFLPANESPQPAEERPIARASAKTAPSAPVAAPVVTSLEQPTSPVTPVQSARLAPAARRSNGRAPSASVAMRLRPGFGPKSKPTPNPLEAPGEPADEPSNTTSAVAEANPSDVRRVPAPSATDAHQATAARQQAAQGGDGAARRVPLKTEDDSVHPAATRAESSPKQREPSERAATDAELDPKDPRAELVFARRMQAAMLAGEPAEVLALCAEHERRWPHGTFVQEREGLRAMASCQADARDAMTRAKRFLGTYPRSTLAPRVRQACAEHL